MLLVAGGARAVPAESSRRCARLRRTQWPSKQRIRQHFPSCSRRPRIPVYTHKQHTRMHVHTRKQRTRHRRRRQRTRSHVQILLPIACVQPAALAVGNEYVLRDEQGFGSFGLAASTTGGAGHGRRSDRPGAIASGAIAPASRATICSCHTAVAPAGLQGRRRRARRALRSRRLGSGRCMRRIAARSTACRFAQCGTACRRKEAMI